MSDTDIHLDPLVDARVVADPQPQPEAVDYVPFEATVAAGEDAAEDAERDLERLRDVPVELAVEIGRTRMTIGETLALCPGSIITLNRLAGEPVDLLVNGKPIARGEVVVIDEEFGLRVTEVVTGQRRPRHDAE
jgi:flagellar motor switch protein FliN